MALRFHEANCVVVGTFNIYIIRPDWLGKIFNLPIGSEIKLESKMDQPGFRVHASGLGATWVVSPSRIVLQTEDPSEDCGQKIDRLMEALPWTPFMALGCNVVYRGETSDVAEWQDKTAFPPLVAPSGFQLKQRTWHTAFCDSDQVYNLQLSDLDDGIEVRANVHTELREKDVDFARRTAKQFLQFRHKSISLIRETFNARIEDAD